MVNKDRLTWGKPCKHHLANKDGLGLRYVKASATGVCALCSHDAPADADPDEFYNKITSPKPEKRTPEEIKARQVAASMRWNAKNKDKTKGYIRKYNQSPARKALMNEKTKAWWNNLTPDEKLAKSRAIYARQKMRKAEKADLARLELLVTMLESLVVPGGHKTAP